MLITFIFCFIVVEALAALPRAWLLVGLTNEEDFHSSIAHQVMFFSAFHLFEWIESPKQFSNTTLFGNPVLVARQIRKTLRVRYNASVVLHTEAFEIEHFNKIVRSLAKEYILSLRFALNAPWKKLNTIREGLLLSIPMNTLTLFSNIVVQNFEITAPLVMLRYVMNTFHSDTKFQLISSHFQPKLKDLPEQRVDDMRDLFVQRSNYDELIIPKATHCHGLPKLLIANLGESSFGHQMLLFALAVDLARQSRRLLLEPYFHVGGTSMVAASHFFDFYDTHCFVHILLESEQRKLFSTHDEDECYLGDAVVYARDYQDTFSAKLLRKARLMNHTEMRLKRMVVQTVDRLVSDTSSLLIIDALDRHLRIPPSIFTRPPDARSYKSRPNKMRSPDFAVLHANNPRDLALNHTSPMDSISSYLLQPMLRCYAPFLRIARKHYASLARSEHALFAGDYIAADFDTFTIKLSPFLCNRKCVRMTTLLNLFLQATKWTNVSTVFISVCGDSALTPKQLRYAKLFFHRRGVTLYFFEDIFPQAANEDVQALTNAVLARSKLFFGTPTAIRSTYIALHRAFLNVGESISITGFWRYGFNEVLIKSGPDTSVVTRFEKFPIVSQYSSPLCRSSSTKSEYEWDFRITCLNRVAQQETLLLLLPEVNYRQVEYDVVANVLRERMQFLSSSSTVTADYRSGKVRDGSAKGEVAQQVSFADIITLDRLEQCQQFADIDFDYLLRNFRTKRNGSTVHNQCQVQLDHSVRDPPKSVWPWLTMHGLRELADVILDRHDCPISEEMLAVNRTLIVYIETPFEEHWFRHYHAMVSSPYVLLEGNSDRDVPTSREGYKVLADKRRSSKILRWFAMNVAVEHPLLYPLPIGLKSTGPTARELPRRLFWPDGEKGVRDRFIYRNNTIVLYTYFRFSTNPDERSIAMAAALRNNFSAAIYADFFTTMSNLLHAKYVLSPYGNGRDCYRHYEALLSGSVPIVNSGSTGLRKIWDPCLPVIEVHDWDSGLNESALNEKYDKLISQVDMYDFRRLFLPFWASQIALAAGKISNEDVIKAMRA